MTNLGHVAWHNPAANLALHLLPEGPGYEAFACEQLRNTIKVQHATCMRPIKPYHALGKKPKYISCSRQRFRLTSTARSALDFQQKVASDYGKRTHSSGFANLSLPYVTRLASGGAIFRCRGHEDRD